MFADPLIFEPPHVEGPTDYVVRISVHAGLHGLRDPFVVFGA